MKASKREANFFLWPCCDKINAFERWKLARKVAEPTIRSCSEKLMRKHKTILSCASINSRFRKKIVNWILDITSECISTFIPIKGTPNTAPSEDHLILSQCPSFICQNIFNLPQVFTNCCAENYCEKVDLAKEKGQLFICLSIEICKITYFAAWAGVLFSRSYISSSQSMNFAYRLLTKSKETYKTWKTYMWAVRASYGMSKN